MLPTVNTAVHLEVKVELRALTINALAEWVFEARAALVEQLLETVVVQAQKHWLERVSQGIEELVCTACGVVHRGAEGWSRRGSRVRKVKTSSGEIAFPLLQVTCGECARTRAPLSEALGLEPRQRVTRELKRKAMERVFETSYRRSVGALLACAGVGLAPSTLHGYVQESAQQLELTPDPKCEVVLADGTKVRAGTRVQQEDLRTAFQLLGRSGDDRRRQAHLRCLGVSIGPKGWPQVLNAAEQTRLVVSDAEPALRAQVRDRYPKARHQFCEWHVVYTLDWSLSEDRVPLKQRKMLRGELNAILWRKASQRRKRMLYRRFIEKLSFSPTSQKQLRQAAAHILFEKPSAERTTSVIERQMREIDRRAYIGVRWSSRGLRNLLLLSMARRHNRNDYERLWS